jgi:hypothetical protein
MKYTPVKNNPVARFYYKGSHTHPVRRTVLVIESTDTLIKGYELREGNEVRTASQAPIKTFKRSKIAKGSSLRIGSPFREKSPNKSTLIRKTIMDLIEVGA